MVWLPSLQVQYFTVYLTPFILSEESPTQKENSSIKKRFEMSVEENWVFTSQFIGK